MVARYIVDKLYDIAAIASVSQKVSSAEPARTRSRSGLPRIDVFNALCFVEGHEENKLGLCACGYQ
jgi:hypothetical protein